jgi:hypothetical protein
MEDKKKYNVLKNGAKSLFTIAKNAAKGIDQSVPEEVAKFRLDICQKCPNFTKTRQCGICFCFCDAKCKIRQESCPDSPSKWGPWTPEDN